LKITHLDHLVLTVKNIEATCAFYKDVLGMKVITFAKNRKALKFGQQKFNLHQAGNEFEPKANSPKPGAIDLCLISETPIDTIIKELNSFGVPIIEGPIKRTGSTTDLISVYVRDPDKNLIEISNTL
jgi:catechol 2,3-dioxygenase-like lactoylglutathione lyase family enzyme